MIGILLTLAVLAGWLQKVDLFAAFTEGAEEGLQNALHIIPCLAAVMTALAAANSSGAVEALCEKAAPLARILGIPPGTLPLVLLRPLSGSASLGLLQDILRQYGPDSPTGLAASVMMGSGETVFYTCAVYLSAAGVKKSRYIIPASLAGWLAGCAVTGLFFQ